MNYSTLKEAYDVDNFLQKKKSKKIKPDIQEDSEENKISMKPIQEMSYQQPKMNDNIQPYYDEDLEQYLNLQDFKSAIPTQPRQINSSIEQVQYAPMQNNNQQLIQQYQPQNQVHNNIQYQQHQQPKFYYSQYKPAEQILQPPVQQPPPISSPQPTQYPIQTQQPVQQPIQYQIQSQPIQETIKETKKDTYYKNLINIALFILVGILIIFVCDQITEIAINIGMRRTFLLLEPYLKDLREKNQTINTSI